MKTIHCSLSVRGALKWPKSRLRKLLVDEKGKYLSADGAREALLDQLALGREVLPLGECPGFDFQSGCPGHVEAA
jgi:hypothetical protein